MNIVKQTMKGFIHAQGYPKVYLESVLAAIVGGNSDDVRDTLESDTWDEVRKFELNDAPSITKTYNELALSRIKNAIDSRYNKHKTLFEVTTDTGNGDYPSVVISAANYFDDGTCPFIVRNLIGEVAFFDFVSNYTGLTRFLLILDSIKAVNLKVKNPNAAGYLEIKSDKSSYEIAIAHTPLASEMQQYTVDDADVGTQHHPSEYPIALFKAVGAALAIKNFAEEQIEGCCVELKVIDLKLHMFMTIGEKTFEVADHDDFRSYY